MLKWWQFTAIFRAAGIVGVLLCQLLKIAAILQLLQQTFGFGLRRIESFLINLAIRA